MSKFTERNVKKRPGWQIRQLTLQFLLVCLNWSRLDSAREFDQARSANSALFDISQQEAGPKIQSDFFQLRKKSTVFTAKSAQLTFGDWQNFENYFLGMKSARKLKPNTPMSAEFYTHCLHWYKALNRFENWPRKYISKYNNTSHSLQPHAGPSPK